MSKATTGLSSMLKAFLGKVGDIKHLVLSTLDGVELLTVSRTETDSETAALEKKLVDGLVLGFATSTNQASKLDMGKAQYSMSWIDHAGDHVVMVNMKMDALVVSMLMDEQSNLGMVDEYAASLQQFLKPFCNTNFINLTL